MERITFDQIVADKWLSPEARRKDLANLYKFKATENSRNFSGNPFIYHYQMESICKTRVKNKPTLIEVMADDALYQKLYSNMEKLGRTGTIPNRLFEAYRFNGAVVIFKASTAKYIYKHFGATKVLDPTAGWGGRMLGAWALGIDYTGIDTNENLSDAYQGMIDDLPSCDSNLEFRVANCLDVDFSEIDYDFVLTSPPYVNLEVYENMTPYESDKKYYTEFLIPLLNKCLANIKNNGYVCFNISPKMYVALLSHGFRAADTQLDLLQQKRLNNDKEDKIYCWRNP